MTMMLSPRGCDYEGKGEDKPDRKAQCSTYHVGIDFKENNCNFVVIALLVTGYN